MLERTAAARTDADSQSKNVADEPTRQRRAGSAQNARRRRTALRRPTGRAGSAPTVTCPSAAFISFACRSTRSTSASRCAGRHGFSSIALKPGALRFVLHLRGPVPGHAEQGDVAGAPVGAQRGGQREPVEPRHVDVGDDDVGHRLDGEPQRLLAVDAARRHEAGPAEELQVSARARADRLRLPAPPCPRGTLPCRTSSANAAPARNPAHLCSSAGRAAGGANSCEIECRNCAWTYDRNRVVRDGGRQFPGKVSEWLAGAASGSLSFSSPSRSPFRRPGWCSPRC